MKLSAVVAHAGRWAWISVLCLVLFCHLSHGRFWWQEQVCSLTLYWVPLIGIGLLITLFKYTRGSRRMPWPLLISALQISILLITFDRARPYVYFRGWHSMADKQVSQVGVLIAPFLDGDAAVDRLAVLIREYQPDIMVMMSDGGALRRSEESHVFPFVHKQAAPSGRGVAIFSKFPFRGESARGVGFGALPSMYEELQLPDGSILELGALLLSPSVDQDAFEDNKVTARRIVTLVRNSSRHRIVVGSFFDSPFSKIVSLYTRQGRLRSVMFGRGFRNTWDMQSYFPRLPADHAFVSKYINVQDVSLFDVPTSRHRGMFFRAIFEPRG